MSQNKTPQTISPLVTHVRVGLAGVKILGPVIGIKANDADAVGGDYYDFVGRPADPTATPPIAAIVGKHPRYLETKVLHAAARATSREAVKAGRKFVANAVDMLKTPLGRRYNVQWASLFATPSLELPSDPVPKLMLLEAHFREHPEHENLALNVTAARAVQVLAAIDAASEAVTTAEDREKAAKQARDASWNRLRTRLSLLREELGSLLSDDDTRWYRFGFRRPMDGETPDLVEQVQLQLGAVGQVIATWTKARLAENYRVLWKVTGSTAEPTPVGLVSDPQTVISGLPHPANITVIVTARNGAGESAPMEAAIAVP